MSEPKTAVSTFVGKSVSRDGELISSPDKYFEPSARPQLVRPTVRQIIVATSNFLEMIFRTAQDRSKRDLPSINFHNLCHSRVVAHRDGDGWIECVCGNRHWGLNGAAGLLLVRDKKVLLQHRAPWVHNGDTWGIPGGARDSHETVIEAALREAQEEIGIETDLVTPVDTFHDGHDGWAYDTIIAIADPNLIAHEQNDESLQVEWIEFDKVTEKNLHPSFAKTWPALLALVQVKFM